MGFTTLLLVASIAVGTMAYFPSTKEHMLSESLLREVVDKMGRDLYNYLEEMGTGGRLAMGPRSDKDMDESSYLQDAPPAIRDQEYLQHSSLWANRFLHDGEEDGSPMKSGNGQLKTKSKGDNTLPAYCNPPNPCPVEYTGSDGCLEDFENSAAFSREYQSQQECMCDAEHMFDCSNNLNGNEVPDLDRLVQQFQVEDEHKNLVAKKFHVKKSMNPYLLGEKLPVAAKKGQNMYL